MTRAGTWLLLTLLALPRNVDAADGTPLILEMTRGSEVRHGRNAQVTLRVRNTTTQPVTIYLRRDLITFRVTGPGGEETTCAPMDAQRHPGRRGFTTLLPHRSLVLTSRLIELCPRWTFSEHGAYSVDAYYDPRSSGQSLGLHAFTGRLAADRPVIVRVQRDARVVQNHEVRASGSPAPQSAASAPKPTPPAPPAPPAKARPVPLRR
jgi:hypothetical protein